ncbi:MAG: hypothetical protein M1391_10960 [Bacteroidetes bacterium]|nr:hypothetical protein [Bacteroidota bacterium]
MRATVSGNMYKFIIELEKNDNNFSFEILSLYHLTHQKSTITNLNLIISELIFPTLKTTDIDTTIFLDKKTGVGLFRESIATFNDKRLVKTLEKALDEDRNIGGWNSDFKI